MTSPRTPAEMEDLVATVLAAPPHRAFGLSLVRWNPGEAALAFDASEGALGPSGQVHGGVISLLAEAAAGLAAASLLPADRYSVTADFHAQFLRPAKPFSRVELAARVLRAGRQLAFCEVEARSDAELCVVANVTKAIVAG